MTVNEARIGLWCPLLIWDSELCRLLLAWPHEANIITFLILKNCDKWCKDTERPRESTGGLEWRGCGPRNDRELVNHPEPGSGREGLPTGSTGNTAQKVSPELWHNKSLFYLHEKKNWSKWRFFFKWRMFSRSYRLHRTCVWVQDRLTIFNHSTTLPLWNAMCICQV